MKIKINKKKEKYMREIKWVRVTPGVTLLKVTPPNIFN